MVTISIFRLRKVFLQPRMFRKIRFKNCLYRYAYGKTQLCIDYIETAYSQLRLFVQFMRILGNMFNCVDIWEHFRSKRIFENICNLLIMGLWPKFYCNFSGYLGTFSIWADFWEYSLFTVVVKFSPPWISQRFLGQIPLATLSPEWLFWTGQIQGGD